MEHKQSKIGFLTVIVGATGTGKTSIARDIFKDATHGCAFDIQQEYDLKGLHEFVRGEKPIKFSVEPAYYEIEDYVRIIENSKGFTFLQEESTGYIDSHFFNSKIGKRLISCVVSKRHIQKESGGGNNYIFIFHSLKSVPPKLWTYIDFFFLFPTVEKDFDTSEPLILKAHSELDQDKRIPFKEYQISDYRVIVRTQHGKDNLEYISNYLTKRTL